MAQHRRTGIEGHVGDRSVKILGERVKRDGSRFRELGVAHWIGEPCKRWIVRACGSQKCRLEGHIAVRPIKGGQRPFDGQFSTVGRRGKVDREDSARAVGRVVHRLDGSGGEGRGAVIQRGLELPAGGERTDEDLQRPVRRVGRHGELKPGADSRNPVAPNARGSVRDADEGCAILPGVSVDVVRVLVHGDQAIGVAQNGVVADVRRHTGFASNARIGAQPPMHPIQFAVNAEVDVRAGGDGTETSGERTRVERGGHG